MPTESLNVRSIFDRAMDITSETDRKAYLDEVCAAAPEIRQQVEALLNAYVDAGSFLDADVNGQRTKSFDSIAEHPGTVIESYKLLQQIGEGGMGVVFMAEQTQPLQRTVALKIIKPGMDTRQVIARFEAERQALAVMDHPNIAKVLDAGTTDSGRPYFVMELVKGVPITDYCDRRHLPVRERLELFAAVCHAVQHAHQKGIIHRDLKPSNVLVAEYDGRPVPKVIDFGVAKATAQRLTEKTMFTEYGQIVGTIEYMSPEQASFNQLDIDTRSDIYSLGVLLYELLAGSTPFNRQRLHNAAIDEMLRIIRDEEPPKPSRRLSSSDALPSIAANRSMEPVKLNRLVQGELDWVVMQCLEKDRNARYASAADVAADLEHWLRDEPLSVCAPDPAYLLRIWLKRNLGSTGWAIALGVIWGIVGGVICWLVMLNPLELSLGVRRMIYMLGVGLVASGGLITVWLVRPKNAAADLVSGIVTGALAAVICYSLSWGWVVVSIAGVPYGIWLGMVSAVVFMGSICVLETMLAGMLLRRHGHVRSTIGPYAELVVPSLLAVVFSSSVLFRFATVGLGERRWHLYMIPPLLLAVCSVLGRWPWYFRALFHAAWVVSLCTFVIM
jgi:serine/threonine protein kinase